METKDLKGLIFLKDLQEIAGIQGGKCLSQHYINSKTHLLWRCQKGHVWEAAPGEIKRGTWCPVCARNKYKPTIDEMQRLAQKKVGNCLSKEYVNDSTHLLWQCAEGHKWKAVPNSIKQGSWCPECAGLSKGTIQQMQKLALAKGGRCLSKEYINTHTHLLWQCAEGHKWETEPAVVKKGFWCPECAGQKPGTIEQMQQLALSRGGRCLSNEYTNGKENLSWQCGKGHKWSAVPGNVKNGTWCPVCAGVVKKSIEEMQKLAHSRGGECLSKKYVDALTNLKWKCDQGHVWQATPAGVSFGSWCAACAGVKKGTIQEMRKMAKAKAGHCLSKVYVNNTTRLDWQCAKGHVWSTAPKTIKKGHWCPIC